MWRKKLFSIFYDIKNDVIRFYLSVLRVRKKIISLLFDKTSLLFWWYRILYYLCSVENNEADTKNNKL